MKLYKHSPCVKTVQIRGFYHPCGKKELEIEISEKSVLDTLLLRWISGAEKNHDLTYSSDWAFVLGLHFSNIQTQSLCFFLKDVSLTPQIW